METADIKDGSIFVQQLAVSACHCVVNFTRSSDLAMELFQFGRSMAILNGRDPKVEDLHIRLAALELRDMLASPAIMQERLQSRYVADATRQAKAQWLKLISTNYEFGDLTLALGGKFKTGSVSRRLAVMNFPKRPQLSGDSIIAELEERLRSTRTQVDFDKALWQVVHDWDLSFAGVNGRRCVVVAIINKTRQDLRVGGRNARAKIEAGKECRIINPVVRGLDSRRSRTSFAAEQACVLFAFARPALGHRMGFDTGRIDVSIECTAFKRFRVTEHLLDVAPKRGNSISMVAKSVEAWWSRYVVVVGESLVSADDARASKIF